jgi:hypothetical protein
MAEEYVIHEERWQSAVCFHYLYSWLFGANNCVRIIFYRDRFIMRLHWPFSLFNPKWTGLIQEVYYKDVVECQLKRYLISCRRLHITFKGRLGPERIAFTIKKPEKIMHLLICDFQDNGQKFEI